jgi:dTDP-4-amino-4,6-dideoxygalactose transaminase
MARVNSMQNAANQNITRRRFLATGCLAVSGAGIGLHTRRLWGAPGSTPIPNIDPGFIGPQFFDKREEDALLEVLESGSPFRFWGPGKPTKVQGFEEDFAKHMGTRFALGVTSGTAALDCAIAGLGIGPGDEVIVPAYTWWSDYTCVVHAGALPVFADIDASLNIDPKDFERRITPRTKAVIAVHLLGSP